MIISRTASLPQTLVLALAAMLASACSGPTTAETPVFAASAAAAGPAEATGAGEGEFGSGTLRFELQPEKQLTLPVTFCAGHGTILTIAAQEGETQVDLRVTELPALREGKPLEDVADAGYRATGSDEGRVFYDIWQTKSMDEVIRDGDTTRARGTMYGLRSYDKAMASAPRPSRSESATSAWR